MNTLFQPVVIPDAYGTDGIGETVVGAQPDCVTVNVGDEYVGYTPDEARAIGRALIAAADHLQSEVLSLCVHRCYLDEQGDVWVVLSVDAPQTDDIPFRARCLIGGSSCYFSKHGHSNPADTSIGPNLIREV